MRTREIRKKLTIGLPPRGEIEQTITEQQEMEPI
jgi:hypothetical protein